MEQRRSEINPGEQLDDRAARVRVRTTGTASAAGLCGIEPPVSGGDDIPLDPTMDMPPAEAALVRAELAALVRAAGPNGCAVVESYWLARGVYVWARARPRAVEKGGRAEDAANGGVE